MLFALCACINGKSIITNISRLQFKESNRLAVGLKIITALGGEYELLDNGNTIEITGNLNKKKLKNLIHIMTIVLFLHLQVLVQF